MRSLLGLTLASCLFLTACDANNPIEQENATGDLTLQVLIFDETREIRADFSEGVTSEYATATLAFEHDGTSVLHFDFAIASDREGLEENGRLDVTVPFTSAQLEPGYVEFETDRAAVLYIRDAQGVRESFSFEPQHVGLQIDRVEGDRVYGKIDLLDDENEAGSAAASSTFEAVLFDYTD